MTQAKHRRTINVYHGLTDKARESDGNLGFTPSSATSLLCVLGQVCGYQFPHLYSTGLPGIKLWAGDTGSGFALSQPVSGTAGAKLELWHPSGFFLPLQNCMTTPVPCSARLPAEGGVFCGLSSIELPDQLESGAAPKLEGFSETWTVREQIHLHPDGLNSSSSVWTIPKSALRLAEAFSVSILDFPRLFIERSQDRKAPSLAHHMPQLCAAKMQWYFILSKQTRDPAHSSASLLHR